MNKGVWAEMLDDRKFYNPVIDKEPAVSSTPGRPGRAPVKRWTMIGPVDTFVMDSDHPFAGKHSPQIKLAGSEPRGIQQSRLTLVKNAVYNGRVILSGDPGAKITVSLIWGPDAGDRQSRTISSLDAAYKTYPLTFTAPNDTADAKIEIVGTGSGSFHIGAISLMPADNVEGFRREVVAALRQLHSGIYRFPGGNFLSAHEWRDAIGDRDRRGQ